MNNQDQVTDSSFTLEPSPSTRLDFFMQDCIKGMTQHLKPGRVDVVVTSPPYNLGIKYNSYDDSSSREEYLRWTKEWALKVREVLSDRGSFFLNIGSKPSDPWVPFEVASTLRPIFHLQNVIHWVKSIAIEKRDVGNYPGILHDVAVGHYKPINSERYLNDCHEYIFHFTKSGDVTLDRLAIGVPYQDKSNIGRWNSVRQDLRCRGNAWFIPYETIKSRDSERPHPATFPPKLPEMCIKLHGLDRCELVMDPFMGLGNTALACLTVGKSFIGFELDPEYFRVAVERVKKEINGPKGERSLFPGI